VPGSLKAAVACLVGAVTFILNDLLLLIATDWAGARMFWGATLTVGPALVAAVLLIRMTRWAFWPGLVVSMTLLILHGLVAVYQVGSAMMDSARPLGFARAAFALVEVGLVAGAVAFLYTRATRAVFLRST